eukprot:TRINITY_DN6081_c0_g2_i1.p1 TRINITY_DN6081_c0_g2~~TRINITY_DN6081_c0_g2_i1.p1  ORF type:complete len:102 (-),score=18.39 TRINITY_DN6081_c0_g2_i1:81-386(-)
MKLLCSSIANIWPARARCQLQRVHKIPVVVTVAVVIVAAVVLLGLSLTSQLLLLLMPYLPDSLSYANRQLGNLTITAVSTAAGLMTAVAVVAAVCCCCCCY